MSFTCSPPLPPPRPPCLQLLRTFELNNDRWCTSKDHAVTAADLGQALLDEACTSFKGMLRQLVAATGTAGKRLTSEAYNRPAPAPRTKTLATRCAPAPGACCRDTVHSRHTCNTRSMQVLCLCACLWQDDDGHSRCLQVADLLF